MEQRRLWHAADPCDIELHEGDHAARTDVGRQPPEHAEVQTSKMLDRLAAILEPDAFSPMPGHEEGRCPYCDSSREAARNKVREIVVAMREPTVEMTKAGWDGWKDNGFASIQWVWPSMVDAILKEGQA
jgi:uncharacterized protein with PIN domain